MLQIAQNKFSKECGVFPLLEFLITNNIKRKNNKVLLLGEFHNDHISLINSFDYDIEQIIKKKIDNLFHFKKFKSKYDVIFCNHIIQYQRNTGLFLDKLFDILKKEGTLIISGPKTSSEVLLEGQVFSFILPVFIQNLIYSGFDCKNGKILSIGSFENSLIVSKDINFNKKERNETGFKWSSKHKNRSPFELVQGLNVENKIWFFEKCKFWSAIRNSTNFEEKISRIVISFPKKYQIKNFSIDIRITEILEFFEFIEFYDQDYKNIQMENESIKILL